MATPSLALIPSGYSYEKVYSVLPSNGDGDFTFDRDSNATRVNKDGLIEEVSVNVPRLDYSDGSCPSLLLEPSSTNLITYSEDFSDSYWTKSNVSVTSGFSSPSGNLNAFKLVEDTSTGNHILRKSGLTTVGTTTTSIYAKAEQRNKILLFNGVAGYGFDLLNGTAFAASTGIPDSFNITELTNGWYKCSITHSSANRCSVYLINDLNSFSYTGDGTSGVCLRGAQVEESSISSSYIATQGSVATRVAETCTDAGTSDTFNDSEGVLYVEISALDDSGHRYISVNNNDVTNRITIELYPSAKTLVSRLSTSGVQKAFLVATNIVKTNMNKIAVRYYLNNFSLWVNGNKISEDLTDVPIPIGLNSLDFEQGNGSGDFYGNTKQIQYYNSALTDAELQELTS